MSRSSRVGRISEVALAVPQGTPTVMMLPPANSRRKLAAYTRRMTRPSLHLAAACIALELSPASSVLSQVAQSGTTSIAELMRSASPAVVTIRALDAKGRAIALGSGFVASDHRVVTNAHVVAGATIAEVIGSGGSTLERTPTAEAVSQSADIVILPRVRSQLRGLVPRHIAAEPRRSHRRDWRARGIGQLRLGRHRERSSARR
jgi:S1-C subfamily serine protease